MTQASWLVTGARSTTPIVLAPGTEPDSARSAVTLVDNALDKFPGPVPGWFRLLERVGYWWYGVCVVAGIGICLVLVPAELEWKISWGFAFGFLAAPVSGALLYYLARLQARLTGFSSTTEAIADAEDTARPTNGDVRKHVETVLGADPAKEAQVHRLAWRAAGKDGVARRELEGLWEKADPLAAAALAEKVAKIQAGMDDLKAQGKI